MGEATLIQTKDPRSKIQVPKSLKWSEVTFLQNWTLENENYPLQIQNPTQNPDLDFVQQLADGTVRLSFDQSRFRSPLDYHQPSLQSPILLRDRPVSRCSSSRPLPHLDETQIQNSKELSPDRKLAPLAIQPNRTQLSMRKTTIVKPPPLPLGLTLSSQNPLQVTSSWSYEKSSHLTQQPQAKSLILNKTQLKEKPIEPTTAKNKRLKCQQNGKNS